MSNPQYREYTRAIVNEAINYLQNGVIPQRYLNPRFPNYATRFRQRWDPFRVVNNSLYLDHRQVICKEDVNNVLRTHWDDNSQRILGTARFYARIVEQYVGITREDVHTFLNNQETKQLHDTVHHQKVVRPILPKAPKQIWQADLTDMNKYYVQNGQKKYLLTVIDCFSKYAYVFALANKNEQTIADKFNELFQRDKPATLQTDNGGEFKNAVVGNVCTHHNVRQVFSAPYRPQSQGMIERFNQTIKRLIFAYMTENSTTRYIDVLQSLVDNYNSAVHGTTKAKPDAIHGGHLPIRPIRQRIKEVGIKPILEEKKILPNDINVGDHVRVALRTEADRRRKEQKKIKGYIQQYSKQIFRVRQIRQPHTFYGAREYFLNDHNGDVVQQRYYRKDLLKIDPNTLVPIPQQPAPNPPQQPNQPQPAPLGNVPRILPNRVRRPNQRIFNANFVH